ncbi:MAG: hypothetical protein ABG776_18950, partial [Cyanobacteria bacterium J06555_13]
GVFDDLFCPLGNERSPQGYTAAKTVRKWQVFLEVIAIPAYVEWRGFSPWQRKQALIEARIASYRDRLARKSQTTLLSTLPL